MSPDPSAKPIRSLREGDPEAEEHIDAFVVRLGEIVDLFQDTEAAGDLLALRKLSAQLASRAEALGYPEMAEAAGRVEKACSEAGAEAAHKCVADLTVIAQRIRQGHRSAA